MNILINYNIHVNSFIFTCENIKKAYFKCENMKNNWVSSGSCVDFPIYEGQSKITESYLITFESSKIDVYLDDISL